MEISVSLARWVVGKALGPVTDHLLESWAASAGLSSNIDTLKMELLYAQGLLENTQGMDIRSLALKELLQKLRQLAYMADDVLDELVYFRIQDALDGTYHAVDAHALGCVDGLVLNVRHITKDVAGKLKFPSCSRAASRGDLDEQENGGGREIGSNHGRRMPKVASDGRYAAHAVGKHFPCYSFPWIKAPYGNRTVQTPTLEFNRVEISKKMVDIVGQLKPVCAKVSTILNLELLSSIRTPTPAPTQAIAINRRKTTVELIKPSLYGRGDLKQYIIDEITVNYCDHELTVLPIVGPGGIGKTTFTQHVYEELGSYFQVSIWICVSVNFNANRLARKIVKMIPKVKGENEYASNEELIEQRLKAKKFLLVLDDVWKCHRDEWKKLLAPFRKGRTLGNMVIVTTRFPKVAKMVRTTRSSIEIETLDYEVMMNLFEAHVFGDQQPWRDCPDLAVIGRKIVSNLKGNPLVAKTLGRLLRSELTLEHWIRVLESKAWELETSDNHVMSALRLSYDNLPFSLRHCVAYCGLFPEDYEFDSKELTQLWIALDILHSCDRNKRVEDVGLCYINDLVNHGFLQEKIREDGCLYYLIHDLVHELANMVLPYECLRIDSSNIGSIQIPSSVRHLSIIVDDIDVRDSMTFERYKSDLSALDKRLKVEDLRTLMLFGECHGSFAKIFGDLFREARALRTVILSGASYNVEDVLYNFSKLVHLRYLRIKSLYKKDMFLPSALFIFYHLEVIDLEEWYGYFGSTRHMSNLVKLRRFLVPKDEVQVHSDICEVGKLKFFQELGKFVVRKESKGFEPSQLGKLTEIGGLLGIYNLERVQTEEEAEEIELMHKNHLQKLILEWDIDRSDKDPSQEQSVLEGLVPHRNIQDLCIRGHGGATCPSWLGEELSVRNLKSLCLYDIAWKNLPPLGKFWFVNEDAEECRSCTSIQSFRNLQRLELVRIQRLTKWVANDLFALKVLIIEDCPELLELPLSDLICLRRLHELKIVDCPKLLSLPPIPWFPSLCSVDIARTGLGFQHLVCTEKYRSELSLSIRGNDGQDRMWWNVLAFSNLINLKELEIEKCPPLPLDHLRMLTSLKVLIICDSSNLLLAVEGWNLVECELPVEDVTIRRCGATGKELTWLLSHFPKITDLSIEYCEKITGLGTVERQMTSTPASSPSSSADRMQQQTRGEEEIVVEGLLLLPPQLQELEIQCCPGLKLLCNSLDDENAGGGGLQGLLSLRTLKLWDCPKFLSSYPSSSSQIPFPASLEKLTLARLEGTETLDPLSNLTCLTNLSIYDCGDLGGEALWPLHSRGQLSDLTVLRSPNFFAVRGLQDEQEQQLLSPSPTYFKLRKLFTDDVAGVLVAPVCSLLSSSLTDLIFQENKEAERFTKEQEEALHLLTSLQEFHFWQCDKLQRLPAGLNKLANLKRLTILSCPAIRSLPKDGLPSSLQELVIRSCPAFKSLPRKGLPSSLCVLDVSGSDSVKLRRQCRKLNGTIPIIRA